MRSEIPGENKKKKKLQFAKVNRTEVEIEIRYWTKKVFPLEK